MKTIKNSHINTVLLFAILCFVAYGTFWKDKSSSNGSISPLESEVLRNKLNLNTLTDEMIILSDKLRKLEEKVDTCCCTCPKIKGQTNRKPSRSKVGSHKKNSTFSANKGVTIDSSRNESNNSEPSIELGKTDKKECPKDSYIVIEEYSRKDTLILLDYKGDIDSMYHYFEYPCNLLSKKSLLSLEETLKWKFNDFLNYETALGSGLIIGGFFLPDRIKRTNQDINLNLDGVEVSTKIESYKETMNPFKPVLITAGGIILLDGIFGRKFREIKNQYKLLNSFELETSQYGAGLKIKF